MPARSSGWRRSIMRSRHGYGQLPVCCREVILEPPPRGAATLEMIFPRNRDGKFPQELIGVARNAVFVRSGMFPIAAQPRRNSPRATSPHQQRYYFWLSGYSCRSRRCLPCIVPTHVEQATAPSGNAVNCSSQHGHCMRFPSGGSNMVSVGSKLNLNSTVPAISRSACAAHFPIPPRLFAALAPTSTVCFPLHQGRRLTSRSI
jgi:hypothetical protein